MRNERLWKVATRYRPRNVKVRFKRGKKLKPAHAMVRRDGTRDMLTPRPDTREGLYYYLHEAAHFALRHNYQPYLPNWQIEYEAEKWAASIMRMEGIPVPRTMTADAKKYIRWCIRKDLKRGLKVPYKVRRWSGFRR
jgi:hypothetical protein